jgi:hypothetical protein
MIIEGPAADGDGVVEVTGRVLQVLLNEHVVADETSAFSFAGDHADPVHCPVGTGGVLAGVFDVVPDAEDDGEEFEADAFVIADGIELAAPFDPPVAVFPGGDGTETELVASDASGPGRWGEEDGAAVIAGGEEDAAAERLAVGGGASEGLVEFGLGFPADAELGAGLEGEAAVARGVEVEWGGDGVEIFGFIAPGEHLLNAVAPCGGAEEGGIEQEGDVGFASEFIVEEKVPEFPAAVRVMDGVFEAELLDEAAFAPAGAVSVMIGADDMHFHFTAGVAAEARTILEEEDTSAVAGGGERGTDAGHAAAGDAEVGLQVDALHMGFMGGASGCGGGGVEGLDGGADVLPGKVRRVGLGTGPNKE